MPHIQPLESHVAELIAAGEVVERPASVVKELVENCIDAGASVISVETRRGGMGMIRVSDNGCGIAPDELPTAFLRHATSKLRTPDDLADIGTLGFRGEALAAISAVSHVEIVTREKGASTGAMLYLDGGVPGETEETGAPEGTTITVRDLFFNTPARLKFMRRDSAETAAVAGLLEHLALSHPEISFRFSKDGTQVFHTPGDGQLMSAIYAALGREFASTLIPADGTNGGIAVTGFVTAPVHGRGSRSMQVFFINGRFIKSPLLTTAVEEAYRNQLLKGKFPGCVLSVTMPPSMVDVNVHPAKTQIKFARERDVFHAAYRATLDALLAHGGAIPAPGSRGSGISSDGSFRHSAEMPSGPRNGGGWNHNDSGNVNSGGRNNSYSRNSGGWNADSARPRTVIWEAGKPRLVWDNGPGNTQPADSTAQRTVSTGQRSVPGGQRTAPAGRWTVSPVQPVKIEADEPESDTVQFPIMPENQPENQTVLSGNEIPPPTDHDVPPPTDNDAPPLTDADVPPLTDNDVPLTDADAFPPLGDTIPPQENRNIFPSETEIFQQIIPGIETNPEEKPWRIVGEVFRTYMICESEDALWMIDKHAAHERMNFDRLQNAKENPVRQTLLTPVTAQPAPKDAALLLENLPLLEQLGFACEDFGNGTILVREVPEGLDPGDILAVLDELADNFRTGRSTEDRRDAALRTVACKASIRGDRDSDERELRVLAEKVQRGEIRFCPHGRPIAVKITKRDLKKMFKRT